MGKGAELAPVQLMPAQLMPFKQHRAHNFSAGAAMFDTNVLAHMQRNFLSYDNSGMGLFVSHTSMRMVHVLTICLPLELKYSYSDRSFSFPPGNVAEGPRGPGADLHRPRRGKPSNAPRHSP